MKRVLLLKLLKECINDLPTMNKPRYTITYWLSDNEAYEISVNTIKEANALYDTIGNEAAFKVLVDNVSNEQ